MSLSHSPRVVSDGIVMDLKASSLSTSVSKNLFTFPEDFTNAVWGRSQCSVVSNTGMAPDGTMTADKIIGTSGATSRKGVYQYVTIYAGNRYTFSVYIKAAGYTTAALWFDNYYANPGAYWGAGALLDLTTGVSNNTSHATMTSVGNGWYRCQVTVVQSVTGVHGFSITMGEPNGNGTPTGNGVDGILLWGAQLEKNGEVLPNPSLELNLFNSITPATGSATVTFTRSTVGTYNNSAGQISSAAINTPRYEYDYVNAIYKGLLIESASTNSYSGSSGVPNVFGFSDGTTSFTTWPTTAPDGTATVRLFSLGTTSSVVHYHLNNTSWTDGNINVLSAYFKANTGTIYPTLNMDQTTSGGVWAKFDLSGNGASVGANGGAGGGTYYGSGIERLANGWYRCWVAGTTVGPGTTGRFAISCSNSPAVGTGSNGYHNYVGAVGDSFYVWGIQIEKDVGFKKPTSYIYSGSRGVDSAVMTGSNFSSWFNQSAGTLLVEYYKTKETNYSYYAHPVNISNGSTSNQYYLYGVQTVSYSAFGITAGGVDQQDSYYTLPSAIGQNRYALSYTTNQASTAYNSVAVNTDYTVTLPTVNQLRIGGDSTNAANLNDCIYRIVYWPYTVTPANIPYVASGYNWSTMTSVTGILPTTYYPVSSNLISTTWTDSSTSQRKLALTQVQVLVVAGGGSGASTGSGGGAGGLVYNSAFTVTPGTSYTVTVGAGGVAPIYPGTVQGSNGGNSQFGSITAVGGGGGRFHGDTNGGSAGGSGGGGAVITGGSVGPGGAGTAGQGYPGGNGYLDVGWVGAHGGGGGAGGPGANGGNTQGCGQGGPGLAYDISGTLTYYAGGGGGGEVNGAVVGKGGIGGGGSGFFDAAGTDGTPNTGGGGGGGGFGSGPPAPSYYTNGGTGGSGVVIVRYAQPVRASGGTITYVGNDVVHTFTSGTTNFVVESPAIQLKNSPAFNAITTSVTLDGVSQYVDCGNSNVLDVGNNITVIAWFKPQSISAYGPIVAKVTSDYLLGWEFANSAGTLRVSLRPGNTANLDLTAGTLALNTWFMGAFTFDGTTCRLYLNGSQTASGTPTGTITLNSTQNLWVGGRVQGNYFAGDIAQTTVYSRALTATEILQNFNASRGKYGI